MGPAPRLDEKEEPVQNHGGRDVRVVEWGRGAASVLEGRASWVCVQQEQAGGDGPAMSKGSWEATGRGQPGPRGLAGCQSALSEGTQSWV